MEILKNILTTYIKTEGFLSKEFKVGAFIFQGLFYKKCTWHLTITKNLEQNNIKRLNFSKDKVGSLLFLSQTQNTKKKVNQFTQ